MAKKTVKLYTIEELRELEKWFEGRQLPESLQLDKATFIPNVKDTLKRLVDQCEINYENPKMQGCIYLLERLKNKLESDSVA